MPSQLGRAVASPLLTSQVKPLNREQGLREFQFVSTPRFTLAWFDSDAYRTLGRRGLQFRSGGTSMKILYNWLKEFVDVTGARRGAAHAAFARGRRHRFD